MDIASQNYSYFETNPNPLSDTHQGIDHHLMGTDLPDPSLHASSFWRVFPHGFGFFLIYLFGGMYFNFDIFFYFPIMFLLPGLTLLFMCSPRQYILDKSCIPSFINNLSWGFWYGGTCLFCCLTMMNHTIPDILPPAGPQSDHHGTRDCWQFQIVFTAVIMTALIEEIVKCYLCHRYVDRFHSFGASASSINSIMLNCSANGMGMAMAKGFLALCLIGNSSEQINVIEPEEQLVFDYRFALLHYIVKPFVVNDSLHPVIMMVIYSLAVTPLHTVLGALWGIGMIRRYALDHPIAFAQNLLPPFACHGVVNVVIAEIFYNVLDEGFTDTATVYGVSIAIPVLAVCVSGIGCGVLFKIHVEKDNVRSSYSATFLPKHSPAIN